MGFGRLFNFVRGGWGGGLNLEFYSMVNFWMFEMFLFFPIF